MKQTNRYKTPTTFRLMLELHSKTVYLIAFIWKSIDFFFSTFLLHLIVMNESHRHTKKNAWKKPQKMLSINLVSIDCYRIDILLNSLFAHSKEDREKKNRTLSKWMSKSKRMRLKRLWDVHSTRFYRCDHANMASSCHSQKLSWYVSLFHVIKKFTLFRSKWTTPAHPSVRVCVYFFFVAFHLSRGLLFSMGMWFMFVIALL